MIRNKRGSLQDVYYLALIMFTCALFFVTGWMMYSKVNENLQANDNIADEGKAIMADMEIRYVETFDGIFLMVLLLMWVAAIVLAFKIDSHPVFFFLSFFVYVFLIIITAIFGNTFYAFSQNAGISAYAADFTIITLVMNNYALLMLFIGFTVGMVMYAKSRQALTY